MGGFAIAVLGLVLAGALVSWVIGARAYARCLAAVPGQTGGVARVLAVIAWPFALGRLQGSAAGAAAVVVNKAIVAVIVCITLAVVTVTLSTNFNRLTS
jgi:hypothetical protein